MESQRRQRVKIERYDPSQIVRGENVERPPLGRIDWEFFANSQSFNVSFLSQQLENG